jgi:hypothetical protein
MTEQDLEAENMQILTNLWRGLCSTKSDPVRIGLSPESARVLVKLDERQVVRAAQVHVPLFDFACTPETLRESFNCPPAAEDFRDNDGNLFLSNRWRASEGSFVSAQMLYNMTRGMHAVMNSATYLKIVAAANSGICLIKLAVRPQYLFHAGTRFDLQTKCRTSLAICNTTRAMY